METSKHKAWAFESTLLQLLRQPVISERATQYESLPSDPAQEQLLDRSGSQDDNFVYSPSKKREYSRRTLKIIIIIQAILNLAFVWTCIVLWLRKDSVYFPQPLYSPAQGYIEYETKVFTEGFADPTVYQGEPSLEVDQAWQELYGFGVSWITAGEASQLVNKTVPIPGDESHYLVQLDVYHQLHCLNMLRKALYPDYYADKDELNPDSHLRTLHYGHCIDSIRQSLMCSADISPIVWQWIDHWQQIRIVGNIAHKCRSYDKIKEWALSREVKETPQFAVHMHPGEHSEH